MSPSRRIAMTAKQFRDILEAAGITQVEAAAKLGYSTRQINRWARDVSIITEANAAYIKSKIVIKK